MKLSSIRLSTVLSAMLLSTSAYAADVELNIFNADLSHPDLEQVVKSFEQVCMPFVLHKTELTRELDKAHHKNLLQSEGFVFQSHEVIPKRYIIEPERHEWRPPSQTINSNNDHIPKDGQFAIFRGVINRTELPVTVPTQTGEINMHPVIPAIQKTVITETETFNHSRDNRMTAHLGWNYSSQNHPGKNCEIKLEQSAISKVEFTESFIEKDADWREEKDGWSQCVKESTDSFRFTVKHDLGSLSLHLVRNDFFETNVCELG